MSTRSLAPASLLNSSTARRFWIRWLPTLFGFIAGGAIASVVTGPVTTITAAVGGGALAGAVIGFGQWLALRGRLPDAIWWVPATAVGQAVGLAAGATLVGYRTGLQDLAIQGAITGLGVGILQALVLRPHVTGWLWWALAMPPLWALGWVVTTLGGIGVDRHVTNFGAFGAIAVTSLSGLLLVHMLRTSHVIEGDLRPVVAPA